MKTMQTRPEHEVAYQDLANLMKKHADKMTSVEVMIMAANMLGKIIAMQDARTMTKARALELVVANLEAGNQQVIDALLNSKGSA